VRQSAPARDSALARCRGELRRTGSEDRSRAENGLFAPAATPKEIVDRLGQASVTAMANPDFQKALVDAGLEPVLDSTPDKARRFVQDEHARLIPVIKATGMKAG
jgi:tripartite-type tricarboxylate transporter receptor subunit TctC